MPATRNQLLARLHCLKKEQGWGDDEYRDILEARTGKRSAGDLDGAALARLVAALGGQKSALATRRDNEWAWVDTAAAARQPLLRKLIVLVGSKGARIRRGGQIAYIEGIAAQMSGTAASAGAVTKSLRLCDEHELWRIVAALNKHVERQRAPRKTDHATTQP